MIRLCKLMLVGVAALGWSVAKADFVIDDFFVAQAVTVAAGQIGGHTVGNGSSSCWYLTHCYRDLVIDNSAASHATTASVVYNSHTPTLGDNYELTIHVGAGDKVRMIVTWDGDLVSGNFGDAGFDADHVYPGLQWPAFQSFIDSNSAQRGNPHIALTLKDIDGRLVMADYSDFEPFGYRPDGYAAANFIFPRPRRPDQPVDFDYDQIAAIQAIVTIDAATRPIDFALRRLKAPEPTSMALAGWVLLSLVIVRRGRVAKSSVVQAQ